MPRARARAEKTAFALTGVDFAEDFDSCAQKPTPDVHGCRVPEIHEEFLPDVTSPLSSSCKTRSFRRRTLPRASRLGTSKTFDFILYISLFLLALTFFQLIPSSSLDTQDGQTDRQTDRRGKKERRRNRSFVVVFSRALLQSAFFCVCARTTTESGGLKRFLRMRQRWHSTKRHQRKKKYMIP